MHKKLGIILFATLALIVVAITTASSQSVYAASPSSIGTAIQASSSHLSGVAIQSIHTADSSKNSLRPKDSPTCFNISITVAKTGTKTNTYSVHGIATFFCGHMYGGGVTINNSLSCPGVGSMSGSSYTPFPSKIYGNMAWSYLQPFTGYCELCTDHVPDVFPYFTITTSVYASTFEPGAGLPISNPASYTISVDGASSFINTGFANSSTYRIPC